MMFKRSTGRKNGIRLGLALFLMLVSGTSSATVLMHIVLNPIKGNADTVFSQVESASLMNCKQLVERAWDIVIIRLECNTNDDLKTALSTDLFPVQLVADSTMWLDPTTDP